MPSTRSEALRIAVYGDVNLNLLDGSAIWLSSLVHVLCKIPDVEPLLLLKAAERRSLITDELRKLDGLRIRSAEEIGGLIGGQLTPDRALQEIERLDDVERFDGVILRGAPLCIAAAARPALRGRLFCYLTDIPQRVEDLTPEKRQQLGSIADASCRILCQTEGLRLFLETHVPEARRRCVLLPPMIPNTVGVSRRRKPEGGPLRIVYAGKFAPFWGSREMIETIRQLRSRFGDAVELHAYGDKIHDPPDDPGFHGEIEAALSHTDGLVWHRGVPRQELLEELPRMDLAWAWRRPELDDSLELSTKLLEYGAAGLPILLNRNPMNEQALGASYPLFADSTEEILELVDLCRREPSLPADAARTARDRSRGFSHDQIARRYLAPALEPLGTARRLRISAASAGVRTVLVAGHDLRFLQAVLQRLRLASLQVLIDRWEGHDDHDERRSRELKGRADLIFCEWCLGNAVWYAKHRQAQQRLVVRFHLQERDVPFPNALSFEKVTRMIFVGRHIRDEAVDRYGWAADKTVVIPNYVDPLVLERDKLPGAEFNLGMIGFSPRRKRLDRALTILERLRAEDDRFVLFLRGRLPWEYPWLWARTLERQYYERQMQRIAASPLLRNAVVFDGWGDVASWLPKVGWVLSPSDFESFHLAVPEGAASGSISLIRRWEGASSIYPDSWICDSSSKVAERILAVLSAGDFNREASEGRELARQRFGVEEMVRAFGGALFHNAPGTPPPLEDLVCASSD